LRLEDIHHGDTENTESSLGNARALGEALRSAIERKLRALSRIFAIAYQPVDNQVKPQRSQRAQREGSESGSGDTFSELSVASVAINTLSQLAVR